VVGVFAFRTRFIRVSGRKAYVKIGKDPFCGRSDPGGGGRGREEGRRVGGEGGEERGGKREGLGEGGRGRSEGEKVGGRGGV